MAAGFSPRTRQTHKREMKATYSPKSAFCCPGSFTRERAQDWGLKGPWNLQLRLARQAPWAPLTQSCSVGLT